MAEKFDIYKDELVDILIKRAEGLRKVNWYLKQETNTAIENVEIVFAEYKRRVEKYQKEHPMKEK